MFLDNCIRAAASADKAATHGQQPAVHPSCVDTRRLTTGRSRAGREHLRCPRSWRRYAPRGQHPARFESALPAGQMPPPVPGRCPPGLSGHGRHL